MPDGAYFSVIGNIRPGAGGQTRVLLLRHRLFAQHLGIDVPILTFNPTSSYDSVRASLHDDGLLLPQSRLLNMHEDLRQRDPASFDTELVSAGLVSADPAYRPQGSCDEELDPQGLPWRRHWTPEGSGVPWFEYLRTDGTTYARTRADNKAGAAEICAADGSVIGSWTHRQGIWRWWTTVIAPDSGNVFLLSDSRYVAQELAAIPDDRFFVLHQMHNPHTVGRRHWTSEISRTYRASMDNLAELDALSSLTGRQRDDVARRFGDTDNLVVIPNPVEIPDEPDPLPTRAPGRIVIIARLHKQKRLDHAIKAFALLTRTHPYVRLDIYGSGPDREALEHQIEAAGLTGSVLLHGHDPHAADRLWAADLAWLTSAFEGYGLFILEARARACPVVSFDVPYGPHEQIADGVDGVLIPPADVVALAKMTGDLLDNRALLESMRAPARAGAVAHDHRRFLADWSQVVADAVKRKPARTRLDRVVIDAERLDVPVPTRRFGRSATGGDLRLRASLLVEGAGDPDAVTVSWQAYTSLSPEPLDLPLSTRRDGHMVILAGEVPTEALRALGPGRHQVTVRLLLVWRNSAWQHDLLPGGMPIKVGSSVRVLVPRSRLHQRARTLAGRARRIVRRLLARA